MMARIKPEVWIRARELYEFEDYSFNHICNDLGMSKGAIVARAKKEGWEKGKKDRIATINTEAKQKLIETTDQMQGYSDRAVMLVNSEVDRRLRLAGMISDGIEKSQQAINDLLDDAITVATKPNELTGQSPAFEDRATILIPITKAHSEVTSRNAKTVFGNEGAGNQQKDDGNDTIERRKAIIQRLREEHESD